MYRLIYLLAIGFLFSYCSTDQDGDAQNSADATEAGANADNTAAAATKKNFEASHEAPYCKLWVIKFAAEVADLNDYRGRWFNLKCDNTFESGQWQETLNKGQWSIEEGKNLLHLYFNDPTDFPAHWAIQGAGGGGRILWKGNVPGNEPGYQVVLESESEIPVKE